MLSLGLVAALAWYFAATAAQPRVAAQPSYATATTLPSDNPTPSSASTPVESAEPSEPVIDGLTVDLEVVSKTSREVSVSWTDAPQADRYEVIVGTKVIGVVKKTTATARWANAKTKTMQISVVAISEDGIRGEPASVEVERPATPRPSTTPKATQRPTPKPKAPKPKSAPTPDQPQVVPIPQPEPNEPVNELPPQPEEEAA